MFASIKGILNKTDVRNHRDDERRTYSEPSILRPQKKLKFKSFLQRYETVILLSRVNGMCNQPPNGITAKKYSLSSKIVLSFQINGKLNSFCQFQK